MNITDILKRNEQDIVRSSYRIALQKQDLALDTMKAIERELERDRPERFSSEEIADVVFEHVKNLPNRDIEAFMNLSQEKKDKKRLELEKTILSSIREAQRENEDTRNG